MSNFNEKLDYLLIAKSLATSAGRVLAGSYSKLNKLKEFGYETYRKLSEACVIPIMDYGSGVWGSNRCKTEQCVCSWKFIASHRLAVTRDTGQLHASIDVGLTC